MTTTAARTAARWLARAEGLLREAAPRLDALNLFPVPDADTGSNMLATLVAASRAAERDGGPDVGAVLAAAGEAALDAARGNSGTLLAVALVGAAEPLRGPDRLTVSDLAAAAASADRAAREALSEPHEGTILSVLTAASEALAEAAGADGPVPVGTALGRMVARARVAVEQTEDQLAPLTRARVVDAGAVGALWVLEALRAEATGTDVDATLATALHGYTEGPARPGDPDPASGPTDAEDVAALEVMCSIALAPLDAAALRRRLEGLGESVILAPLGRTADAAGRVRWRVHVHVADGDAARAALAEAGEPEGLTVTDLRGPAACDDADAGHGS